MDLLSSRPFWPIRDGLPATFPPLNRNTECDVVVIGSGISGSAIAWQLALAGLEVVVLDRREVRPEGAASRSHRQDFEATDGSHVEEHGDRAVVDELHRHLGPEPAGGHGGAEPA